MLNTDCASGHGTAIGRVRPFPLYLLNQVSLTIDLHYWMCMAYDHNLPENESQGHTSKPGLKLRLW